MKNRNPEQKKKKNTTTTLISLNYLCHVLSRFIMQYFDDSAFFCKNIFAVLDSDFSVGIMTDVPYCIHHVLFFVNDLRIEEAVFFFWIFPVRHNGFLFVRFSFLFSLSCTLTSKQYPLL